MDIVLLYIIDIYLKYVQCSMLLILTMLIMLIMFNVV